MTTPPISGSPGMGSDISNQLSNWQWANQGMMSVDKEYAAMIVSLMAMTKAGHACQALWIFQTQCMPLTTQSCEYSMQTQADALNIANDLRNDITGAQNSYNQLIAEIEKEKVSPKAPLNTAAAHCASNAGKALSGFLQKLSHDLGIPNMGRVLPSGTISSLKNYINTIRTNGQGPVDKNVSKTIHTRVVTHWESHFPCAGSKRSYVVNHSGTVSKTIVTHYVVKNTGGGFFSNMNSMYWGLFTKGGVVPPQFTQITNSFNSLNQSVSGISSQIQAQMQYLNQSLQQFFGIYKSFFDDYSQLSSYIVNKSN